MTIKVLLLSRYSQMGASSRIRFYQYVPYLLQNGVEVEAAPLLDDGYLTNAYQGGQKKLSYLIQAYWQRVKKLLSCRAYDLIWIQAELFPYLPAWPELLLSLSGVPYIVDYDDPIFHYYDLHKKAFVRRLLGRKIDHVMCNAALVITGNAYLENRASLAGAKRIEHLPSVVDLARYTAQKKPGATAPVTIGWIGSPPTARYLELVQEALIEAEKQLQARIVLVGAGAASRLTPHIQIRPWTQNREIEDLLDFDIGIMPVANDPWSKGKCGYKLIQYMACGLPTIASPVGVNTQIVQHGISGFLATTSIEWSNAIKTLHDDPMLRASMGMAGRQTVETTYSLQVTAPRLLSFMREVADK